MKTSSHLKNQGYLSHRAYLEELAEILSRGCLRLILSKGKSGRPNLLKELDNSQIASHELVNRLTAKKGRNKI